MKSIAQKFEIDFTEESITGSGGSAFLSRMAQHLGLPQLLEEAVRLKQRRRGASDVEMLLSLIYTLGQGDGAMRDVDRLGADAPRRSLLELEQVPGSRRVGEYLARFEERSLAQLAEVGRRLAKAVSEEVIRHELQEQGYLPVFMDGSGIEVSGEGFEGAGPLYDGSRGYWLHGVFVGPLWTAQRLWPGGVEVARGWKEQLAETAELIGERGPVWVRLDNAYYRKEVVEGIAGLGWDYSVSVTSATYKRPLKEILGRFERRTGRRSTRRAPSMRPSSITSRRDGRRNRSMWWCAHNTRAGKS